MKTSTAYASGWVHAVLLAAAFGCGGGGGDSYDGDTGMVEPPYTLARFEFAPNQCAFDSREAMALAELQYPVEFGYCFIRFIGNTENGKPWPAKSWPSTPRLS